MKMILYPYFSPLLSKHPLLLHTSNNYFYLLWKQHFFVISNPLLGFLLKPLLTAPWLQYERPYFSEFPDQSFYAVTEKYYATYPNFSKETALLKIPQKDREKGWKVLNTWGISEKDWFVCFYAREPGYYNEYDSATQGKIRNVSLETYHKALLEITGRGGWCIRMGAPETPPLPPKLASLERLIDYPKSPFVSDFMDVFLMAHCKFLLTCSSGISLMPGHFGVPIVMTNIIPMHVAKPLYPKDLGILKKYYSKVLKRFLSFREAFSLYTTDQVHAYYYDSLHLEIVDNTEEEIYAVTLEMLDRLEGIYREEQDYKELQSSFDQIIPQYLFCKNGTGKLGYQFLKTHSTELQKDFGLGENFCREAYFNKTL